MRSASFFVPALLCAQLSTGAHAEKTFEEPTLDGRQADVRLVVTGGLGGLRRGFDRFWTSPVFRGETGQGLVIQEADAEVYQLGDDLFFADVGGHQALTAIGRAGLVGDDGGARVLQRAFLGPGAMVLSALGEPIDDAVANGLGRVMAAVPRLVAIERRTVKVTGGEVVAYGVDFSPHTPLLWPSDPGFLVATPAARGTVSTADGPQPLMFVARGQGSTARVLGMLDALLARSPDVPTRYIDIGNTLAGRHPDSKIAREIVLMLQKRQPVALFVGRSELAVRAFAPDLLDGAPYLVGAEGGGLPASLATIEVGERKVLLSAIGGMPARMRALLPRGARALSADKSVIAASQAAVREQPELVMGVATSDEGERAGLDAAAFDAVFRLSEAGTPLMTVDDVDLTRNHDAGLHTGPALIRIVPGDVTEVRLWMGASGQLERMRIDRYPVVGDGPRAADAQAAVMEHQGVVMRSGLPSRRKMRGKNNAWNGGELSQLRAELVRRELDVEIALLQAVPSPVPVEGEVPAPLVRAWLSDPSRAMTTWLRGVELNKVFGAMKKLGSTRFAVAGANLSAGTVAERGIAPLEYYRVAITPWVIDQVGLEGVKVTVEEDGLKDAPSVSFLIEGSLPRLVDEDFCLDLLDAAGGESVHAFFFEVSNLALSGSLHGIRGNEDLAAVRDSRIQTPNNFAIGVNGRIGAFYEGPWNSLGVFGESQLDHVSRFAADRTRTVTETRDVLLFEADLRLKLVELIPWDRAAIVVPRPTARLTYQTEWTPNFTIVDGAAVYQPRRSELRGLIGFGVSPQPWLKDLRLGVLIENDFATTTAGALEWGGEAAISGQWAYEVFRFNLDAFVRAYAPDPARDTADDVGLVTQMIARVEVPVIFDIGLSGFVDLYAARGKTAATHGPTGSVIVGAAVTYGQRLKWVPFR
jgi:hypothetical protein